MESSNVQQPVTPEQAGAQVEAEARSEASGREQGLLAAQRALPALTVIAMGFLAEVDPVINAVCSSGGCGHA